MNLPDDTHQTPISTILDKFTKYLKYTYSDLIEYIGTTTNVHNASNSLRDIDVIVVFRSFQEGLVAYLWRIIRKLSSEFNILLDTRIYSHDQLGSLPIVNRYLLKKHLKDYLGENPFSDMEFDAEVLSKECIKRISDQEATILRVLPRIANSNDQLRVVAQCVFDAMRAFLLFKKVPLASKEDALAYFQENLKEFPEAKIIYDAFVDPNSVYDISDFIVSSLALVKHLNFKTVPFEETDEVLLINTPSSILPHPRQDFLSYDQNMPLGLVCVATYLNEQGIKTRILDSYAENLGALSTVDRIFVSKNIPKIVGLNSCSPNIHVVHRIAKYIKRIAPEIITVCGGPHASLAPAHTLSGSIDYCVLGEGEIPLLRLAQSVFSGKTDPGADIPSIMSMHEGRLVGELVHTRFDLSKLLAPDFSMLPLSRYLAVRRRLYIHTSRGCAFKCIYCSVPRCLGDKVTNIPLELIIAHLRDYIRQYEPDQIQIVDDNFSHLGGRFIRDFCEAMQREGLMFKWKCQARADQLDRELIEAMAIAGCFEIDLGIESGDRTIQKFIRKNLNLRKTVETIESISKSGIVAKAFFMLGFPNESYEQIASTINYSIQLRKSGLEDIAFFPVMPFPGTEISELTGKVVFQGAVIDEARIYERTFAEKRLRKYSAKPELSLNHLFNPEQLRLLVKFAYERFNSQILVQSLKQEFEDFIAREEADFYAY